MVGYRRVLTPPKCWLASRRCAHLLQFRIETWPNRIFHVHTDSQLETSVSLYGPHTRGDAPTASSGERYKRNDRFFQVFQCVYSNRESTKNTRLDTNDRQSHRNLAPCWNVRQPLIRPLLGSRESPRL